MEISLTLRVRGRLRASLCQNSIADRASAERNRISSTEYQMRLKMEFQLDPVCMVS